MAVVVDGARAAAPSDLRPEGRPLIVLGEIHSGMLQNSGPLTSESVAEMLTAIRDDPVRLWERPIRQAISSPILTGVDCDLPSTGATRRAVGTLATEISVTDGRLLQTSTQARVTLAAQPRRLAWSHYLTRPGVLEVLGSPALEPITAGFLGATVTGSLELGGVCVAVMGRAQASTQLDRRAPLTARRTRMRWTATVVGPGQPATATFAIEDDGLRTLALAVPASVIAQVSGLCESLARHDWILSSVNALVESADIGRRPREAVVRHLRPAIDNLLHTWMPTARLSDDLLPYWHEIDRRSGLSVHWNNLVQRIRDQLALALVERPEGGTMVEVDLRGP